MQIALKVTTTFKRMGLMAASIALLATASGATASADDAAAEKTGLTDKEILIGSCSALTGSTAYLGTQQVLGARACIENINDQGGVNGRKIKLIFHDDGYEPEKAIECFDQLIKESVFAAAFFVGTPTAAKYVPMAESHKVPLIGLYTGAQLIIEPVKSHIFNVRASYFDETREQIDGLWGAGYHKIGVIHQSDAFGAAVLAGVNAGLKKYGSAPIQLGSFKRNTLDVDDAIKQVKDKNPDAVVIAGTYTSTAEILKRAHALDWHPFFTTVSFVGTEALIKAAGKDAEGCVITQVVPPFSHDDLPAIVQYKKLLKKYFPKEQPNFASLEGFVDAMVMVEGLKRAGKDLTRSKFVAALESIHDLDMGLGKLRVTFGPLDHKGFDTVYLTQVRNGLPVAFHDWKTLKSH